MSQEKGTDGRRRLHPAKCTTEELLTRLGTDPNRGLSPKEADKRLEKSKHRPLFGTTEKPFSVCLKTAFHEPVLWILLAVCVIALFFDRAAMGLSCLLLAVLHAVVCGWMAHRTERLDATMEAYDAPLSRVLRNGRTVRVSGNRVVKGDILLLYPGDVVPADVRLLTSQGLVVTEHRMGGSRNEVQILRLNKDAAVTPEVPAREHSPENMIFAGAVVEEGTARALVVAVGEKTHLGAMSGSLTPAHTTRVPVSLTQARKYIALWNLGMVGIILPVTVIGIFTLGHRFDLMDLFLTSLALATVSLTEHVMAKGMFIGGQMRAKAAHHRDVDQSADIKSSRVLEQLGDMTHLVLVGTAGLHDGRLHPTSVMVDDQSYPVGQADPDAAISRLSQWLYLWKKGVELHDGPAKEAAAPVFLAVDDIHAWVDPDAAILSARTEGLNERWGEVEVKLHDHAPLYLKITTDFSEVDECTHVASCQGKIPFDGEKKFAWYRAYGKAMKNGHRVYYLLSEENGETCVEAMLIMSIRVCRKTRGCIEDLEEAGIQVTAFLRDVNDENTRTLEACGLTDTVRAHRPDENGNRPDAMTLTREGVRAFEGCDTEYVRQYIDDIRARGGRVGVLAVEREDIPLLHHADVAITCAPRPEEAKVEPCAEADGRPDSACASDLARRCAHVIVRRSSVHGGGVCALRYALLTAARFRQGLQGASRFLLISQLLRMAAVLLPVIFGVTLLTAPAVLLSGLVVDLAVVICFAFADLPSMPDDPAGGGASACLRHLHVTLRREWIAAGISAVLPWVVTGVARLMGVSMGKSMVCIAFLTLTAGQLAVFLMNRPPRRSRLTFAVAMLMVGLYVGAVAVGLGMGVGIMWCLLWPLLQPVTYLAVRGFFTLKDHVKKGGEV